ncbi:thioredoxin family protein [Mycolicibacterium thermoresistibile]
MSTTVAVVITAVIAVIGLALVTGRLLSLRTGLQRGAERAAHVDTTGLDLSTTGPTIVHFSADWCGPCTAVRRVVEEVCAQLPGVARQEVDLDANPDVAQRLSVMSLPTTLVFDAAGLVRYRTMGVPRTADLRAVVEPLLVPADGN